MIHLVFRPIYKTINIFQKTISLAIARWPLTLGALVLGFSFEEVYYGFRILRLLSLI